VSEISFFYREPLYSAFIANLTRKGTEDEKRWLLSAIVCFLVTIQAQRGKLPA
jgi:hypothetical protein